MSEIWGAALAVAGSVYGADQQKQAGKAAGRSADAATQLQREIFEQTRRDQLPFIQAGARNLNTLEALNAGDFSGFTESPDFQFARDQAIKSLDRSAAARGTQFSGGQLAALADRGAGLAAQTYDQYYNRIAQLAGLGQNAAAGVGNAGVAFGSQAGNNIMAGSNARIAGSIGAASTYRDLGEQLGGAFGRWFNNRKQPQPVAGTGGSGVGGRMGPY